MEGNRGLGSRRPGRQTLPLLTNISHPCTILGMTCATAPGPQPVASKCPLHLSQPKIPPPSPPNTSAFCVVRRRGQGVRHSPTGAVVARLWLSMHETRQQSLTTARLSPKAFYSEQTLGSRLFGILLKVQNTTKYSKSLPLDLVLSEAYVFFFATLRLQLCEAEPLVGDAYCFGVTCAKNHRRPILPWRTIRMHNSPATHMPRHRTHTSFTNPKPILLQSKMGFLY